MEEKGRVTATKTQARKLDGFAPLAMTGATISVSSLALWWIFNRFTPFPDVDDSCALARRGFRG
jgi:hypothetical protein